jgi:hypothetical protein
MGDRKEEDTDKTIKERTTEIILPVTSDIIFLSLVVNNSRY